MQFASLVVGAIAWSAHRLRVGNRSAFVARPSGDVHCIVRTSTFRRPSDALFVRWNPEDTAAYLVRLMNLWSSTGAPRFTASEAGTVSNVTVEFGSVPDGRLGTCVNRFEDARIASSHIVLRADVCWHVERGDAFGVDFDAFLLAVQIFVGVTAVASCALLVLRLCDPDVPCARAACFLVVLDAALFATVVFPHTWCYGLHNVVLHETGHALGLDHEDDVPSIMRSAYEHREDACLRPDDVAGVSHVYGGGAARDDVCAFATCNLVEHNVLASCLLAVVLTRAFRASCGF